MVSGSAAAVGRWTLATSLLLANGASPALRHTHAGGGVPHTHEAESPADHGHAHPHSHPHVFPLTDGCSHVHFSLFGIEFMSLPRPADDEDDSDARQPQLALSPLSAGCVPGDLPGPRLSAVAFAIADDEFALTLPVSRHFADGFASLPRIAAPLCDTARHERSGVQLI
jgi:hypothetical protein